MMKVFLDTNILLDYVDHREKRIYAKLILGMAEEGIISVSPHSAKITAQEIRLIRC